MSDQDRADKETVVERFQREHPEALEKAREDLRAEERAFKCRAIAEALEPGELDSNYDYWQESRGGGYVTEHGLWWTDFGEPTTPRDFYRDAEANLAMVEVMAQKSWMVQTVRSYDHAAATVTHLVNEDLHYRVAATNLLTATTEAVYAALVAAGEIEG